MSLLIGDNLVVRMHYKLSDVDGNVLDSSEGSEPLAYLHGAGNIISGLETALVGKVEGDSLQVSVEPSEGYGEIIPELITTIDISSFEGVESVEAGMEFESESEDGVQRRIMIKEVNGDDVTIDANHPLAGAVLNFDVEIVTVRAPTAEEIEHGHAH